MTEAKKTTKKAAAPKAAAKKVAASNTVTVKQVGSAARSEEWVYQTLKGLGLNKLNRVRTLVDTPEVRGMINRVHHLVQVVDAK